MLTVSWEFQLMSWAAGIGTIQTGEIIRSYIHIYIFHSLFTIHWLTIKQQLSIIVQCNPTKNAHMPMLKHQELFHYFAVYHRPSLFYIGSTAAAVLEVSGYLTDWRFFSSSCTLRPDVDH